MPGIIRKGEGKDAYLTIAGKSGLLIPVYNDGVGIVALKVRVDEPGDGPKYLYLSSTRYDGPGPGSPFHQPPRFSDGSEVRITEGELKATIATERTGILTLGLPGASIWKPALAYIQLIGSQRVRLAFDADARQKPTVAGALLACAKEVKELGLEVILETWDPRFKGIDDLLAAGGKPSVLEGEEAMAAIEQIAAEAGSGEQAASDDRPKIIISPEEHEVNAEAVQALANDPDLYQRGNLLVRVVKNGKRPPGSVRRSQARRIEPLPQPLLREKLTVRARWYSLTQKGLKPEHPPGWCVSAVGAYGHWPGIRPLEAVVGHPVLKPDGSVLLAPGYDADTGIFLLPTGRLPALGDNPTREDAIAARDALLDVVCDFPFAGEEHRAAWVASVLTPLARFAFAGVAPLFLVDGNAPGVGKGLLLQVTGNLVTGADFVTATYSNDEDELRKRITSIAIGGDQTILLDNLTGKFGNGTLDAALTSTTWKDRVLGANRMFEGPLFVTWYATGNNVAVQGDTIRRTCHIRLETREERPEERTGFKYKNLIRVVRKRRLTLLGAALTILRAYCLAGMPDVGLAPWGSFEGWSELVRGSIVWVGLPDPGKTRTALREHTDTEVQSVALLMRCWQKMDEEGKGLRVSHVLNELYGDRSLRGAPPWYVDMREAVEALIGSKPDARALGIKLRGYRSRVVGGRVLATTGSKKAQRWIVRSVEEE